MKYALVKLSVHLLGSRPFVIVTDHAFLRTETQSPHLSQRMAQWLTFFAKYSFEVKYKRDKQNILADALSRIHTITGMQQVPLLWSTAQRFSCYFTRVRPSPKMPRSMTFYTITDM